MAGPLISNAARPFVWCAAFLIGATTVAAQDLGRYRDYELGSGVAAVAALTDTQASEAKVLHQRPALIQELTWRPRFRARRPSAPETESVAQMVFAFHNDALYRMTVDYDSERTAGLTNSDLIQSIVAVYGPVGTGQPPRPLPRPAAYEENFGALIAYWAEADRTVMLYRRSPVVSRFTLVLTNETVAALVRTASARADVLDAREAPAREAAREQQDAEDRRAADEKARAANKGTFRP